MGCRDYAATWVITEKTDNLSKTESKVKARLTMGNSSKEFSKDSVQFLSPTCGRDTVKAITGTQQQMVPLMYHRHFSRGTLCKERCSLRTKRALASGY